VIRGALLNDDANRETQLACSAADAGQLPTVSDVRFGGVQRGSCLAAPASYRLSVRFRPGNDITLLGPACTERLDRINITAYAGDLRSYPTQVEVTGHNRKLPEIKITEPAASPWLRPG
jgi:hypothetical protein